VDALTISLITLTAIMLVTTYLSYRQGNEKRDVGLMGVLTGLFGVGSLFAFIG